MIYLNSRRNILFIKCRDAVLEFSNLKESIRPDQILLWMQKHQRLLKEVQLHEMNPGKKGNNHMVDCFHRMNYFFKNYLFIYRHVAICKKSIYEYDTISHLDWVFNYGHLEDLQLDLLYNDFKEIKSLLQGKIKLSFNMNFLSPILQCQELLEKQNKYFNESL